MAVIPKVRECILSFTQLTDALRCHAWRPTRAVMLRAAPIPLTLSAAKPQLLDACFTKRKAVSPPRVP